MPTPDILFSLGNGIVFVGWMILIFAPRRHPWLNAVPKYAIPCLFGFVYAGITLSRFFGSGGGYGSLAEVRILFSTDELLLAGWLHYLAFDLFVGCWIAGEADRINLSRLIQAPILLTTFIFPPVGLVLFLATRAFGDGVRKALA
jgi:hypothetical protein